VGGVRLFAQLATWLTADVETGLDLLDADSDVDSGSWEWAVDLQISLTDSLFVGAGYRRIDFDIDDERRGSAASRKFEAELGGYFVSLTYRF